jgi:signal peptidase I
MFNRIEGTGGKRWMPLSRIKHSKHTKTVLIFVSYRALLGVFLGLRLFLNTEVPIRVVESGSMCVPYDGSCEGWLSVTHSFAPTLHKGDIIIIQGIEPEELNTDYPNSDIIVYKNPARQEDTPIVHRIATSYEENGTLYFQTKGDGNDTPWPAPVNSSEYDSRWQTGKGVPEDLVEGKVILGFSFGWITFLANYLGCPVIALTYYC